MRKVLLCAVVCVWAAPAVRADDAARAVVEKAVKAAGSTDAKAMSWKDKGKFHLMGQAADYTADWVVQFPDKYRFNMKMAVAGQQFAISAVLNGDKAWQTDGTRVEEVKGEKLQYMKDELHQLYVIALTPLLTDKGFTLTAVADKEIDGKPAAGVAAAKEGRPTVTLYFDKGTGLPAMGRMKSKDEFQNWKEVTDEVYLSGWKKVANQMEFTKFKVVRDGKVLIESELSDFAQPEKVDPKTFEKP